MTDEKQEPEQVQRQEVRAHTRGAHVREVRLTRKKCPVCGTEFLGTPRQLYDKKSCREKAYLGRSEAAMEKQRARVRAYQARRYRAQKAAREDDQR
jgi:hypothetical protein